MSRCSMRTRFLQLTVISLMLTSCLMDAIAMGAGPGAHTGDGGPVVPSVIEGEAETLSRANASELALPDMSQFYDPPNEYRVLPIYTGEINQEVLDKFDSLGVGGLVINNWNWNETMLQSADERDWTLWVNDYYMYPSGNANPMGGIHEKCWNPGFEISSIVMWPDGWSWSYYGPLLYDRTGAHAHSGAGAVAVDDMDFFFWPVGVMPGQDYRVTAWAAGEAGTDFGAIFLLWYNVDGLVGINYTGFQVGTDYTQVSLTATAPAGASVVKILIRGVEAGKYVWYDDVLLSRLDPLSMNTVTNPGFELDLTPDGIPDGWIKGNNPTYDTTGTKSHLGNAAVKVNGTDTYQQVIPVNPGNEFYFSEWMKADSAVQTFGQLAVLWLNDTYQLKGFSNSVFLVNETYVHHGMVVTVPAGISYALIVTASASDAFVWVDDVLFFLNPPLTPGITRGPVLDGHPELEAQGLYYAYEDVSAPADAHLAIPQGHLISAVAAPVGPGGALDLGNTLDMKAHISANTIVWGPPSGLWRVMAFVVDILYNGTEVDPAITNMHQINVLNKVAVQGFIDAMYVDTIEARTGGRLGKSIKASFSDEVSNLAGYLLTGERYPVVAWLDDYVNGLHTVDTFQTLNGYDIVPFLPALFNDVGPSTAKYRIDFYETTARLQGEAYYNMTGSWCTEHGMASSGHPLGEESLVAQVAFYGDFYESVRHMGYPGMDSLIRRAGDRGQDILVPKMVSSASVMYGKPHTMTEYSVASSSMNYRNMTAIVNWHEVQGIDTITSFSFITDLIPDSELKAHAEHVGRTGYMVNQGRYSADIAVLYPITSFQAEYVPRNDSIFNIGVFGGYEHEESFKSVTANLLSNQQDFIYINDENIMASKLGKDAANSTVLHHGVSGLEIKVLVIPEMDAIETATLERIRQFYDAGGIVVSVGDLPFQSAENGTDPYLALLFGGMFDTSSVNVDGYSTVTNQNGGIGLWADGSATAMSDAIKDNHISDLTIMDGIDPAIYYMKRTAPGFYVYYIVNNGPFDATHDYRLEGMGDPAGWNPETGEVSASIGSDHEYDPITGYTTVTGVTVSGFSSVFIVMRRPVLEIRPDDVTFEPAAPILGDKVTIRVNVTNVGSGFASNVSLGVMERADGRNTTPAPIGKTRYTTIGDHDNVTLTFTWDTIASPGLREVDVRACLPPFECTNTTPHIYVNTLPKVEIVANRTEAYTGDGFSLSAGNTTDVDGPLMNMTWDLGDGNTSEGNGTAHSYADDGVYNVTLTVKDSNGTTNATTIELTVLNRLPVANFTISPSGGNATTIFIFNASKSSDPDGDIVNLTWDMGDGTSEFGTEAVHKFLFPGNRTVRLTVMDDDGARTSFERNVTLDNLAPYAIMSVLPFEGDVTTEFMFTSLSYDEDGIVNEHSWDFGDGTNISKTIARHRFTDDGNFTVTLRVRDELGLWSTNDTFHVLVKNLSPVAVATPQQQTVKAGEDATLGAEGTTDPDDDISQLTFAWDFGDGGTDQGINVTHSYKEKGTYNVTLTVTDDDGAISIVNVIVYVEKKEVPITEDLGIGGAVCIFLIIISVVALCIAAVYLMKARKAKGGDKEKGVKSKEKDIKQEKDVEWIEEKELSEDGEATGEDAAKETGEEEKEKKEGPE